ncbi:hypothetical protein JMJ77_0002738 [Colletotrichum scovillei]|uniref:Uncharacterized protein n=1 Tax=Colletotrichum scovillei TaxID=1209932 RepID=A0A9P7UJT7_9PEZI|nr:hypothetical protein JMJ77_0002738 [Colletotrichum scovillei]KAG7071162.1 hypothetical protein JMJ76_0002399 [Colletotrichum scovillei]KAG7079425.1 hypothetical protein JMJ78_0003078 [Colletotrichum scovillei]
MASYSYPISFRLHKRHNSRLDRTQY